MSRQVISKNKIGARCLTKDEARAILPTYNRIYEQIEQFRKEKTNKKRIFFRQIHTALTRKGSLHPFHLLPPKKYFGLIFHKGIDKFVLLVYTLFRW